MLPWDEVGLLTNSSNDELLDGEEGAGKVAIGQVSMIEGLCEQGSARKDLVVRS